MPLVAMSTRALLCHLLQHSESLPAAAARASQQWSCAAQLGTLYQTVSAEGAVRRWRISVACSVSHASRCRRTASTARTWSLTT